MFELITQIIPSSNNSSIFNFSTFISGLALLAIVYTISNVRYHFRLAITPFSIYKITYFFIAIIGIGTLAIDLYLAEGWQFKFLGDLLLIQFVLAATFLSLVLTWMFIAFIYPPIFNRLNYKKFTKTIYIILAKGSDAELPIVADELGRSAHSIIKHSKNYEPNIKSKISKKITIANYTHDLLLMIGHRKLCRHIVSSAPGTAIELFKAMERYKKYDISIGQFAVNISVEALSNPDSSLYHEDNVIKSGLFGHIKPFSKAIYGNYPIVESLAARQSSPLHLPHTFTSDWNAKQLQAYCRCALITIESYLLNNKYYSHSVAINHAISTIKDSCNDLYKINEKVDDFYNLDSYKRLLEATRFTSKIPELIDKHQPRDLTTFKANDRLNLNLYDAIAKLMLDIIFSASQVTAPPDKCWSIQYVNVWHVFFDSPNNSKSLKIIHHKLRRLLYNVIMEMIEFPNYKSARILGLCLNVMGLTPKKDNLTRKYHALHKTIINCVIKNFHNIATEYPDIAATCLQGNVSYDKDKNQLIYSHISGMNRELKKIILQLN